MINYYIIKLCFVVEEDVVYPHRLSYSTSRSIVTNRVYLSIDIVVFCFFCCSFSHFILIQYK